MESEQGRAGTPSQSSAVSLTEPVYSHSHGLSVRSVPVLPPHTQVSMTEFSEAWVTPQDLCFYTKECRLALGSLECQTIAVVLGSVSNAYLAGIVLIAGSKIFFYEIIFFFLRKPWSKEAA